ncbi:hypothetical protein ACIP1G_18170 [Pseudomonas sp. NPDC089392]|uniref:hypothetical protein n=1 Tax=Pseudomonas sp. NPDC089392 TaxID=3364459 RepID=UPI003803C670
MECPSVAESRSLDDFLKEMRERAQTLGWDAILSYDRQKTNILLIQQYIDRFAEGTYFPVFPASEIEIGEGIYHALMGLVMAKPRISFENSSLADSKAMLTLNIVGGKHVQLSESYPDGKPVRKVERLANQNAAAGAALYMDITLQAVPGSLEQGGKVMLDISQGSIPRFSGVATDFERSKLGEHLQNIVKSNWGAEITNFELSKLSPGEDELFSPGRFGIRTQAAPKGKILDAEEYGDGAVVVFAAMEGRDTGKYPELESDMLYMLPDSYSSNLVLGSNFLMTQVVLPWLERVKLFEDAKFELSVVGGRLALVAKGGVYEVPAYTSGFVVENGLGKIGYEKIAIKMYEGNSPLRLFVDGDRLKLSWRSESVEVPTAWYVTYNTNPPSGDQGSGTISVKCTIDAEFKFVVAQQEGRAVLKLERVPVTSERIGGLPDPYDFIRLYYENFDKLVARDITLATAQLAKIAPQLDAFRLNNLLFQGSNIVLPRDVHWPLDLTVLGDLAPERTEFVISPSELVVKAGGAGEFKASTVTGVTWELENLPGETGALGTIVNGKYTAPAMDDDLREKGHRQLIVKATYEGKTSKALVSLVESEISVYPFVAALGLGSSHSMIARMPRTTELKWSQPPEGLGTIDTDVDPVNGPGYKYFAPTSLPKVKDDEPLYYHSIRLAPIDIADPVGGSKATIDMLIVGGKSGNYWLETKLGANGGILFTFNRKLRDGKVEEVPQDSTEWSLLKGQGNLDKGVFTPASGAGDKYAIVVAFYDDGESTDRFDYVILPLPFIDEDRFVSLGLATQEA